MAITKTVLKIWDLSQLYKTNWSDVSFSAEYTEQRVHSCFR